MDNTHSESAHAINGVEGRMFASFIGDAEKGTFSTQTWKAARVVPGRPHERITVAVRHDDNCRNGRNSFAMTADITEHGKWVAGGCCHDEIAAAFPELAHLIKWHLCDISGPMRYIANTVYMADDRDCHGLQKGEARQLRNGKSGLLAWRLADHNLPRYMDAETRPSESVTLKYEPWLRIGEGKERELDNARAAAVWPDATDEDLTAPGLADRLQARLPALLAAFRADVESCGFAWMAS